MQPNGYELIAAGNHASFADDARAYGQANGVHVEVIRTRQGSMALFNKGFPFGMTPFSDEAKAWAANSPVHQDIRTRWHRGLADGGC